MMWAAPIAVVALVVLGFVAIGYIQGRWTWDGTGFEGASLWDWLDLLIVPVVLGIGGIWLQRAQRRRELAQEDRQRQRELELEDRHRQRELEIAEQQAQDNALQAYLEQISQLLVDNKRPLHRASRGDSLSTVARARTLTVLGRVDSARKSEVMRFLVEAHLVHSVGGRAPIVGLTGANLRDVTLHGANLSGAGLDAAVLDGIAATGADLSGADLSFSWVRRANLINADLTHAALRAADLSGVELSRDTNFSYADLREANLSNTELSYANFSYADLRVTYLRNTNLKGANFSGANLYDAVGPTNEELERQARSLKGTIMPNGQKYEDWLKDKESRGEDV